MSSIDINRARESSRGKVPAAPGWRVAGSFSRGKLALSIAGKFPRSIARESSRGFIAGKFRRAGKFPRLLGGESPPDTPEVFWTPDSPGTLDAGLAGTLDAGLAGTLDAGLAGTLDAGLAGTLDAGLAGGFYQLFEVVNPVIPHRGNWSCLSGAISAWPGQRAEHIDPKMARLAIACQEVHDVDPCKLFEVGA